jgi:hypothetical protein
MPAYFTNVVLNCAMAKEIPVIYSLQFNTAFFTVVVSADTEPSP